MLKPSPGYYCMPPIQNTVASMKIGRLNLVVQFTNYCFPLSRGLDSEPSRIWFEDSQAMHCLERRQMKDLTKIAAFVVLLAAIGLLAFANWLPALMFLPVAGGLFMLDPAMFSSKKPNQDQHHSLGFKSNYRE